MKYLTAINFDDDDALKKLSINKKLISYGELAQNLNNILHAYNAYRTASGNVVGYTAIGISGSLQNKLKKHYSDPPNDIKILNQVRVELSPDVCPMCGNHGAGGTLDHVFPKADFAEFTIFTKNLVPACGCNIKRKNSYIGTGHERVLHPYYDAVLKNRILIASYAGNPSSPEIGLANIYSGPNNLEEAVSFHIREVIKKTAIVNWLQKNFAKLLRKPREIMPEIPLGQMTMAQFNQYLQAATARVDSEFETPNNWESIFFAGLFQANATFKDSLLVLINGVLEGTRRPEDF